VSFTGRRQTRPEVVAVDVLVGDLLGELDVDEEVVDLGVVVLAVEGVQAGGDAAVSVVGVLGDDDLALEALRLLVALWGGSQSACKRPKGKR
jgi:hypothetical protein